jgi:hypothetical protein
MHSSNNFSVFFFFLQAIRRGQCATAALSRMQQEQPQTHPQSQQQQQQQPQQQDQDLRADGEPVYDEVAL